MSTTDIGRYYNSDTVSCKIFVDENQKFNAITSGVGSYGESFVEYGDTENPIHILIGRYTAIGENTTFLLTRNIGDNQVSNYTFGKIFQQSDVVHRQIIIGNDVRIGRGCTIFSGVKIGNGSIVSDDSVVREDVPPYSVVSGNPAKVIRRRFTADIIDKLQKIKWWYWDKKTIEERLPIMEDVETFCTQFDVPNQPISQIKKLVEIKRVGGKVYLFLTDFKDTNPVWENVLTQYIKAIPKLGIFCLVVGCANDSEGEQIFAKSNDVKAKLGLEQINLIAINLGGQFNLNFLYNADVFITTREDISSTYVDYATDYNKAVLSGLDDDIFQTPKFISVKENTPLLTIGIPTYNRSNYLQRILQILCSEVGNDPRVEILISDNNSDDDTKEVAKRCADIYKNVRYSKNDENIGGDRNILKVYKTARGKFVVAHDDDDTTFPSVWSKVLSTISRDDTCGVIGLLNATVDFSVVHGTTISEYINFMSYWTTNITTVILKKSAIDKLEEPDKCVDLHFNQLYLQLKILKKIPSFYVIAGVIFQMGFDHPTSGGYNYAEVFIKNYFDILDKYSELSKEEISREKYRIFQGHVLSSFFQLKTGDANFSFDKGEKIFSEYYKDEPYYKQAVEMLMKIDATTAEKRWAKYLE